MKMQQNFFVANSVGTKMYFGQSSFEQKCILDKIVSNKNDRPHYISGSR